MKQSTVNNVWQLWLEEEAIDYTFWSNEYPFNGTGRETESSTWFQSFNKWLEQYQAKIVIEVLSSTHKKTFKSVELTVTFYEHRLTFKDLSAITYFVMKYSGQVDLNLSEIRHESI